MLQMLPSGPLAEKASVGHQRLVLTLWSDGVEYFAIQKNDKFKGTEV